jgi:prepilin-type processing-associated H-X9-DG protein
MPLVLPVPPTPSALPARLGLTDATATTDTQLHLDRDRDLRRHPGGLPLGQADAGHDKFPGHHPGHHPADGGADYLYADGHAHQPETYGRLAAPVPDGQPNHQGHPDPDPDPDPDRDAVLGRVTRPVRHELGVTVSPRERCQEP